MSRLDNAIDALGETVPGSLEQANAIEEALRELSSGQTTLAVDLLKDRRTYATNLRDQFAGQAVIGLLARGDSFEHCAVNAYEMADQMLCARGTKEVPA